MLRVSTAAALFALAAPLAAHAADLDARPPMTATLSCCRAPASCRSPSP